MCFVTIPSATPVVRAYNSASAELKLTVCCVLCTRSAFQVSHNTLQIHLVTLGWTCDLSCCFLHAVHEVCSLLAHVQQFSHNCSVHCLSFAFQLNERFCRWRPLHTRSHHGFCFLVSSCRSLNHSAQEIYFVTCLLHSSCDPHQNLL